MLFFLLSREKTLEHAKKVQFQNDDVTLDENPPQRLVSSYDFHDDDGFNLKGSFNELISSFK